MESTDGWKDILPLSSTLKQTTWRGPTPGPLRQKNANALPVIGECYFRSKNQLKMRTGISPTTTILALAILLGLIVLGFWGCPQYNVWQQEMSGKAEFAKAEQNRRRIKIEEAKANLEAEKLNAQAEIERAKGAAEAIRIENNSLTPTYIQYLWVRQQSQLNDKTVIYIPTEANLPILEAGRVNLSTSRPDTSK